MSVREALRREFDAEPGTFVLRLRCDLEWDWAAFRLLTAAMYDVADAVKGQESLETWIANGFWFCDTWVRDWTSHPNFPRPDHQRYTEALELFHDLAYFVFYGESPYADDTLRNRAKG